MTFSRNWSVKATRKPCQCEGCRRSIPVGEPAERWAGMSDGSFWTASWHPECRAAEIAMNALHGAYADEWQGIADIDHEDRPWLVETFPAVAARMGIIPAPAIDRKG